MALNKEVKQTLIEEFKLHNKDVGSTEVQIALLTKRIRELTEHFKIHKKDLHSKYGLQGLVSQRRRLLKYLKRSDVENYRQLISRLELRDSNP